MFRLAIGLAIGIIVGFYFPTTKAVLTPLLCAFACLYLAAYFFVTVRKGLLMGVLGFCLMLLLGIKVYVSQQENLDARHFSHITEASAYVAVVDEEMIEKANSIATRLKVRGVNKKGQWLEAMGNVLVYFPKGTLDLKYGDWLLVHKMPQSTEQPKNPREFDYRKYLELQNVYHQQYIPSAQYVRLKNSPESRIWAFAYASRAKLSLLLKETIGEGQEYAVASMLVLGIKQTIPQDLMEAYSGAGAVHVLAVSGMHVGLIFALLELLFGRFSDRLGMRPLFYLMALLGIWSFGFLTAFSPSVLRAVVMFSFVIIGKWLNRNGNLYNILGSSAFAILLFAPAMLFNIGFQLSFMAVWGIAYLHPRIFKIVSPANKLVKWSWEITSASIGAQLATLPLCLFYFNQYPIYSLVSNLWVIPLGTLILYLGIFFFLGVHLAWWKWALGWLLKQVVWGLNKSMFWVVKLPFAVLHTSSFTYFEVILLSSIVLLVVLTFHLKQRYYLVGALSCALFYSGSRIYRAEKERSNRQLVFYSLHNNTVFALINGNRAHIWADKQMETDKLALKRKVYDPLRSIGAMVVKTDTLPFRRFILESEGKKVAFLNGCSNIHKTNDLKDLDFLYVTKSCMKLPDFVTFGNVKEIILPKQSGSTSLGTETRVWDLQQNGALEVNL